MWPRRITGIRMRQLWGACTLIVLGVAGLPIVRLTEDWVGSPSTQVITVLLAVGTVLSRWRRFLLPGTVMLGVGVIYAATVGVDNTMTGTLLGALTICVATMYRPWPAALITTIIGGSYLWIRAVDDLPLARTGFDSFLLAIAACVAISIFLAALVDDTRRIDLLRADVLAAQVRRALGRATEQVRHDIVRLIHDDAIPALMQIADSGGRAPQQVRQAAIEAARQIDEFALDPTMAREQLADLLAALRWQSPIEVAVSAPSDVAAAMLTVEGPVRAAIERACNEALRNAAKHADASAVAVTWSMQDGEAVLELSDDGRGLAPGSHSGWGIENSIRTPMRSIGGDATVTGRDGVVVTLRWPVDAESGDSIEASYLETMGSLPSTRRFAYRLGLSLAAAHAYLAVRYSWGAENAVGQLGIALALTAGTVAVLQIIRRQAPTRLLLIAIAASAALADLLSLHFAGPESLSDYTSWVIGYVALLVALPAFVVPPRWSVVLIAPSACAVAAFATASGYGISGALNPLLTACVTPAALALMGGRLRADSRATAADQERLRDLAAAAQRDRLRLVTTDSSVAVLREEIGPFLAATADASSSITAEHRRAARLLALTLRDELALPGYLDRHVRSRLRVVRELGTRVQFSGSPSRDAAALGLRVLDRIIEARPSPRSIALQFHGSTVQVQVSPAGTVPPAALTGVAHTVRRTRFFDLLTVHVQQSPEALSSPDLGQLIHE